MDTKLSIFYSYADSSETHLQLQDNPHPFSIMYVTRLDTSQKITLDTQKSAGDYNSKEIFFSLQDVGKTIPLKIEAIE